MIATTVAVLATLTDDSRVVARQNVAGDLDATFAAGGTLTTDFGAADDAQAVAIQLDGKIVVAGRTGFGDFALARYNSDGSLDASFDDDGRLTTDFGASDTALDLALQSDGKIVVVGQTGSDFAIARYEPDGRLDASFDGDGRLTTDFGGFDVAYSLAIQPDGKVVVAGYGGSNAFRLGSFALARYNPDGALDSTFDGDGKVGTAFGVNDGASAVALQPDGKIVAAGFTCCASIDFAVVRYNPDGSLDGSFDGDGKLTTDLGGDDQARDLAIQPDGKLVVVGSTVSTPSRLSEFALARYNADGSLDTGFDGDGKVITDFTGNSDEALGLALQADGRIVAVGCSNLSAGGCAFGLARYEADGSLDLGFGVGGKVTTDFSGSVDQANDVALQADGKIVAVGFTALNLDFALARYHASAFASVPPTAICQDQTLVADLSCLGSASIDNGSFSPVGLPITVSQDPPGPYSPGGTLVTLTVTDSDQTSSACQAIVNVVDTTPPTIAGAYVTPSILWPADRRFVDVAVHYEAADACAGTPVCTLDVASNEPNPTPAWDVIDPHLVQLRSERDPDGTGRTYTIGITCADTYGNSATQSVTVSVPLTAPPRAVDLGTLGGTYSAAQAVNDKGQVIGFSYLAGDTETHAFSWTRSGGMVDLGTLGGTYSFAYAINDHGQVVGLSSLAGDTVVHAFSWTGLGGMVDLGTLGGVHSYAQAVDSTGRVVGTSGTAGETGQHAFSWTPASGMVDLGTLGGTYSQAQAVSNGHIVGGSSDESETAVRAFSWTPSRHMVDLGTLGGTESNAWDVNAAGHVVGYSTTEGNAAARAFLWTRSGGMRDLGTLGGSYSGALALNENGRVVGHSALAGDTITHGFSWTRATGMIDLGSLGGTFTVAVAVNASGQVVGQSYIAGDTAYHAFSWTPSARENGQEDDGRARRHGPSSSMIDLGGLGGTVSVAQAINDRGQIVGYGSTPGDRETHAVLWPGDGNAGQDRDR